MTDNTAEIPDFTPKELLDSYFDAMVHAYTYVNDNIMKHINQGLVGDITDHEQAILGIFYRMHILASSVTRLNNKLDFNAIALIARTLFELLLDLKLLSNASPEDIERFSNFARIDRYKKFEKLLDLQKNNPGIEKHTEFDSAARKLFVEDPVRVSEIQTIIVKLWGRKNAPDHWSGLKIRERAKKFGPLYEQEYLEIYSLLSWYVHAGNTSYANFGPEFFDGVFKISIDLCRKFYIEGLIICAKKFSLPNALEDFFKAVNYLKDAPREILIEYGLEKYGKAAAE